LDRQTIEMLVTVFGPSLLAVPMTLILLRWKPTWSIKRRTLWSSLPLPAALLALCALVFANAATASEEDCGVDACGMAMMFAMILSLWALAAFFIGAGISYALQRFEARNS
jgi:hypothetical protein